MKQREPNCANGFVSFFQVCVYVFNGVAWWWNKSIANNCFQIDLEKYKWEADKDKIKWKEREQPERERRKKKYTFLKELDPRQILHFFVLTQRGLFCNNKTHTHTHTSFGWRSGPKKEEKKGSKYNTSGGAVKFIMEIHYYCIFIFGWEMGIFFFFFTFYVVNNQRNEPLARCCTSLDWWPRKR